MVVTASMLSICLERIRAPASGGESHGCGLLLNDGEAMIGRLAQIAEGQAANKARACGTLAPLPGSLAEH